jgi:hypothetical protein
MSEHARLKSFTKAGAQGCKFVDKDESWIASTIAGSWGKRDPSRMEAKLVSATAEMVLLVIPVRYP